MANELDAAGGEVVHRALNVALRTQRPAYPRHARAEVVKYYLFAKSE